MNKFRLLLSIVFAVLIAFNLQAQQLVYQSPVPGSILNSLKTNIIIRTNDLISGESVKADLIEVKGYKSGVHTGNFILSDDGKTLVFNPFIPFLPSEEVTVSLKSGISTVSGDYVEELSFNFTTTALLEPIKHYINDKEELIIGEPDKNSVQNKILADTLPGDLMPLTIGTNNNPDLGNIFFANMVPTTPVFSTYLSILNDTGKTIKYKKISSTGQDFTVQPNGLYSYMVGNYAYICDSTFKVIDSVTTKNGYKLDFHEFLVLPDGHYIVMSYDPQPIDMTTVIKTGGVPNATVTGVVIQEQDKKKNVVFQWRSWDHFKITDCYSKLTTANIDAVHMNSIFMDFDGNLITSSRFLSEITKISRKNGAIIWRLGGKNNQFTFVGEHPENDPTYFSYEHDARRISNGNITLFDNGNQHTPNYSRAVEYKLDEVNLTAALAWEFRRTPDIYSSFMGNAQRLPSGNTFICWGGGSQSGQALMTEVKKDKSIALEIFVPKNYTAYRAHKFALPTCPSVASVTKSDLSTNTYTLFDNGTQVTGTSLVFSKLSTSIYPSFNIARYNCAPVDPVFDTIPAVVYPYRLELSANSIDSYSAAFTLDVTTYPPMNMLNNVSAYYLGSDSIFHRIPTTNYNNSKNLVFNFDGLGEILFGLPAVISAPLKTILWRPLDSTILNIKTANNFKWSNPTHFISNEIQISTDKNFNNILIDTTVFVSDNFNLPAGLPVNNYYWQVRTKNVLGFGPWSDTWSFQIQNPFISIVSPNGGETFYEDSSANLLKWKDNLPDLVKVELYRNGSFYSLIKDSLNSPLGAMLWIVPKTVPADSTYSIKVTSKKDSTMFTMSTNYFKITNQPNSVSDIDLSQYFKISVNPNPADENLNFQVSTNYDGTASLKLLDITGSRIADIFDNRFISGNYSVSYQVSKLVNGIYFYQFDFKGFTKIGKIEIIR